MAAPIHWVFLDAAGTLFHLAEPVGETYARHARDHGQEAEGAVLETAFRNTWKTMPVPWSEAARALPDEMAWWREFVRRVFESGGVSASGFDFDTCFQQLWDYYRFPEAWQLYPETVETLDALQSRVELGVISNFDDRLQEILEGLGLSSYFTIVICSSAVQASKPDARIFEAALEAAGCKAENALHVGDDPRADWSGGALSGLQVLELDRPDQSLRDVLNHL